MFLKFKQIINKYWIWYEIVNTWIHYFQPVRKNKNKIWLYGKRPVVVQRTTSIKKILYCIFFSCDRIAVLYKFRYRRIKVLEIGKSEMLYHKSSRNNIIIDALSHDLGVFAYFPYIWQQYWKCTAFSANLKN